MPRLECDCGCGVDLFENPRMSMIFWTSSEIHGRAPRVDDLKFWYKPCQNERYFWTQELGSWISDPDGCLKSLLRGYTWTDEQREDLLDLATMCRAAKACRDNP